MFFLMSFEQKDADATAAYLCVDLQCAFIAFHVS